MHVVILRQGKEDDLYRKQMRRKTFSERAFWHTVYIYFDSITNLTLLLISLTASLRCLVMCQILIIQLFKYYSERD